MGYAERAARRRISERMSGQPEPTFDKRGRGPEGAPQEFGGVRRVRRGNMQPRMWGAVKYAARGGADFPLGAG
eukprot:6503695-Pyramimonas_sp.AAC.1